MYFLSRRKLVLFNEENTSNMVKNTQLKMYFKDVDFKRKKWNVAKMIFIISKIKY